MCCRLLFYIQCLQLLIIVCVADFTFEEDLYEGSPCKLDENKKGICKNITECPEKIKQIKDGSRGFNLNDRCGFVGSMEVVCCPLHIDDKFGSRPADIACQQFENELPASNGVGFFILNGDEAAEGEFPFMAALGYRNKENRKLINYDCGGSLISSEFVLTAAHCIVNLDNKVPAEVRMGSIDLEIGSESVQRRLVDKTYPHPNFKISASYYDIALIKVKSPFVLTASVRPICLPTKLISNEDTRNASIVVIGFGATNFDNVRSSKLLKTPQLGLVNRTECNRQYAGKRKVPYGIDETMLCGKDSNTTRAADACQGDSGGPLLLQKGNTTNLLGITSFGSVCGGKAPGVYTSVYPFLDWIESQVWGTGEISVYPESIVS